MLERLAGDRFEELELILSFSVAGIADFDRDVERHRHRLGELEELGADWTIVGPPWSPSPGPDRVAPGLRRHVHHELKHARSTVSIGIAVPVTGRAGRLLAARRRASKIRTKRRPCPAR